MKTIDAVKILRDALTEAAQAPVGIVSGCGRVYICPVGKDASSALRRACKPNGKRWIPGLHALYFGYDNASGRELAQGTVLAKALTAAGIDCYMDAVGD